MCDIMSMTHDICHMAYQVREAYFFSPTRIPRLCVCGVVFVCSISSKQMDLMIALEWYVDACSTTCKSNAIEVGWQDWQWQTKLNSQFTRSLTAFDASDIYSESNDSAVQLCKFANAKHIAHAHTHTTRHDMHSIASKPYIKPIPSHCGWLFLSLIGSRVISSIDLLISVNQM